MLKQYYNLISANYPFNVITTAFDRQHNTLILWIYHSLNFKLCFKDNDYTIVLVAYNGYESSIIGGRILSGAVTEENILESIEYILNYTRLRLGYKYFEGMKP